MDDRILNYFINELAAKKGYRPLKDENGGYSIYDNFAVLAKDTWGSVFIVELVDGDAFTADEIRRRMEHNQAILDSIKDSQSSVFSEVFIFRSDIDEEKLEVIKKQQKRSIWGKRYLVSFTIQLDRKEIRKHFTLPMTVDGLQKLFAEMMAKGYEMPDYYSLQNEDLLNGVSEESSPVKPGIPIFTYFFLGINILMWLAVTYISYRYKIDSNEAIIRLGAKYNLLIMEGQYWRFVTPMFLHWNIIHLLVNSYSLYAVGPAVESIFGRWKFLVIYMTAGILGNIASFALSLNPSAGASGAIFGLLGALLFVVQRQRIGFRSSFGASVIITIGFNILYGFSNPGIDNFAHIGGLIGGYMAAAAVSFAGKKEAVSRRVLVSVLLAVILAVGIYGGFENPRNVEAKKSYEIRVKTADTTNQAIDSFNTGQYQKAEELSREALKSAGADSDIRNTATDVLVSSLINQGKSGEAVEYAKTLAAQNTYRGHYLLGLCYLNTGKKDLARDELKKAHELSPDNNEIKAAYDKAMK